MSKTKHPDWNPKPDWLPLSEYVDALLKKGKVDRANVLTSAFCHEAVNTLGGYTTPTMLEVRRVKVVIATRPDVNVFILARHCAHHGIKSLRLAKRRVRYAERVAMQRSEISDLYS